MKVVVDASVAVKWALPDSVLETDFEKALDVLAGIRAAAIKAIQPPHWFAEVAAVISRLSPAEAELSLELLNALELPVAQEIAIYRRASRLAAALDHHLFDTLYHAVALERGAVLVTADDRYERKARPLGAIVRLAAWAPPPP